jgi:hypothetical protein
MRRGGKEDGGGRREEGAEIGDRRIGRKMHNKAQKEDAVEAQKGSLSLIK